jgi:hypothetical protein
MGVPDYLSTGVDGEAACGCAEAAIVVVSTDAFGTWASVGK